MTKSKRNGFTLVELLFVLAILSILLALTMPLTISTVSNQQENQFFNTFQFDVLYTQNLSLGSKDYIRIIFNQEDYTILNGTTQEIIATRELPPGWRIDKRNLNSISFNRNGSIRQAGTISVFTGRSTYKIIFPIGKGRGYIEKE
ncbi:competence type IV pilus minor pilin ComGD [Ornithinibacillus salinisoli]|uniref:Competence type IV pilus minor pilin ComGD n=1 Tax=Ornithinibacillus salinisoli TaxID=1848459 RepID=A0ABW4W2N8_9BACI